MAAETIAGSGAFTESLQIKIFSNSEKFVNEGKSDYISSPSNSTSFLNMTSQQQLGTKVRLEILLLNRRSIIESFHSNRLNLWNYFGIDKHLYMRRNHNLEESLLFVNHESKAER